jgi:hypothetical protein
VIEKLLVALAALLVVAITVLAGLGQPIPAILDYALAGVLGGGLGISIPSSMRGGPRE